LSRLKPDTGDGIDDAMNRVLGAEQAAREGVAGCRDEAEAIVARAEADARAIARRAERRIRAAHGIADRGIARALAELGQAETSADATAPDPARIDAIVARLARELTGPEP
jgi:hypothetical protein